MVTGALPPREAYDHVEWPILIMIGALIPVSDALHTTGGTELIARWLSATATGMPAWRAAAARAAVAMVLPTPVPVPVTISTVKAVPRGFFDQMQQKRLAAMAQTARAAQAMRAPIQPVL